jgi:hypothetical protein
MKKKTNNPGYEIEDIMKKKFGGVSHKKDCVDFQTKGVLYEVKSCSLIINCGSGKKRLNNKKIITTMLGRFFVKTQNHDLLKFTAEKEKKDVRYIFVVHVGKQKIWKTTTWEFVDKLLNKRKDTYPLHIKDIFKRELRLK